MMELCLFLGLNKKIQEKKEEKRLVKKKVFFDPKRPCLGKRTITNPNVYTKEELIEIVVLSNLLSKNQAIKSTKEDLCEYLKKIL